MSVLRLEKGSSKYDCRTYTTNITGKAIELEKPGEILYVPLGDTTEKTPIKVGDLYILTHARKTVPSKPRITSTGYGSVVIESDAGSMITYKGETKASGSTWVHDSFKEYSGVAFAYNPASPEEYQSHNSESIWIGMLGKPRNIGKGWHWDNYGAKNESGVDFTVKVTGTTRSDYYYESVHDDDYSEAKSIKSNWYFHTTSKVVAAESSSGDIWEANGIHDSTAKNHMFYLGKTFYHAEKDGWVNSCKEKVKSDL